MLLAASLVTSVLQYEAMNSIIPRWWREDPCPYACALSDTEGRSKGQDGLMSGNVLALYTHLHFASQPTVAVSLVESTARTVRQVDSLDRQRPGGN